MSSRVLEVLTAVSRAYPNIYHCSEERATGVSDEGCKLVLYKHRLQAILGMARHSNH